MTVGAASRRVALDALVRIERDDAYANLALGPLLERSGLPAADRHLVTDLVYGTIRHRRACDYLVDRFLTSDPPPPARAALRMGAYQLHFSGVPDHAAVATTVAAAPTRYRGLVNAVLRRVAASPVTWPDQPTELSYPDWIVERLTADLGTQDGLAALAAMNERPEVTRRDDGYIQDRASTEVARALAVGAGDVVADLCAAPGGKASLLAAAGARVAAVELRPSRAATMAHNLVGLVPAGAAMVAVGDAGRPPLRPAAFDVVLVDAPCSGLGVLARRPDARWRVGPDDVERLGRLQTELLVAAADLVRPGGRLFYSVCTLTAAETLDAPDRAADRWGGRFEDLEVRPHGWRPWGSAAIVLPQDRGTDGMALRGWRRRRAGEDHAHHD